MNDIEAGSIGKLLIELSEEIATLRAARAEDARRERAAVVAWLRTLRAGYAGSELMALAADAIERGEHRREEVVEARDTP